MGNAEKAMQYFKMALEKGYLKLNHIEQDDDLDLIKSTEEYKTLMEKYWKQLNELLHKEDANKTKEMNVYEIPINATSGGTYNLTCEVNDLAMSFTLDTGCSDVSLSSVESQFMLKNGYLTEKDLKGKSYYINATGERHESQVVILREIKLGDFVLKNVRASIVPNQKAPLLLGQNVLNKFGTMEIDNDRKLLILKSYK
jgi:clan AA aspartic protease (TIGR02281 family)